MDANLMQNQNYEQLPSGSANNALIDKLCALLLCLSPLLQHYVGLYENLGFTVLLVVTPILLFRLITHFHTENIHINCLWTAVPLILFQLYALTRQDFAVGNIIYRVFMVFVFLGIAMGGVNFRLVLKYATIIGMIGAVSILVQFVLYQLFQYHLRMIPVNYLLPGSDMWLERVTVGTHNGDIYRPSGIFLEPSHYFLYTFPLQTILLLAPRMNKARLWAALLLSAASICSTSGMGVVVTCALWGVYYLLYKRRATERFLWGRILSARTVLIVSALAVAALMAYLYVPVVRSAIDRILVDDTGKSAAISGRVDRANLLLEGMSGLELLFGAFVPKTVDFNLSGFHATVYRFGIIGILLTYCFYGQGLLRLKGRYFYLTAIILVVSFFSAHTHGTFYMLYFTLFLMNGYNLRENQIGCEA